MYSKFGVDNYFLTLGPDEFILKLPRAAESFKKKKSLVGKSEE
jgi:hypothetical protein